MRAPTIAQGWRDEVAALGQRKSLPRPIPRDDRQRRLGEGVHQVQDVVPILASGASIGTGHWARPRAPASFKFPVATSHRGAPC
jgi:hypothetical protein